MVYVVLGSRRTLFGSFGRNGVCMGSERRGQVRRGRALENFTCVCVGVMVGVFLRVACVVSSKK